MFKGQEGYVEVRSNMLIVLNGCDTGTPDYSEMEEVGLLRNALSVIFQKQPIINDLCG